MKQRVNWRRRGSIYTPWPKNSRWANSYLETPGICPDTLGNPNFQPMNSTRTLRAKGSGVSGPIPGVSGLGRETLIFALLKCFVAHEYLSRFSWALVSSQHLWIKSLLIVRRPYNQISKIKSNSMSMLEHHLFHFLFEGPYAITWFVYTYSSPAHMLNYTIKYTCILSLFTKTHLGA